MNPDRRELVPVAEFLYRHEAEFAAGFLDDAGIPYRLMIDDAGGADLGVTLSRPARLWVLPEHVREVRDILDLDAEASDRSSSGRTTERDRPRRIDRDVDGRPKRVGALGLVPLCGAERIVAALFALLAGAGWQGGRALFSGALGLALAGTSLLAASAFALAAVSGRTWPGLRAALRALSGVAP